MESDLLSQPPNGPSGIRYSDSEEIPPRDGELRLQFDGHNCFSVNETIVLELDADSLGCPHNFLFVC
jgi:hypothetical protein